MAKYEVPGMTLIPQKLNTSCWYASAQMLVNWRQEQSQQSFAWLVPPELDAQCIAIRDGAPGINNPQIMPMSRRLGLAAVPPVSLSLQGMLSMLQTYGPLWVNGKTHIVVIAGIDTAAETVKVYDPWPPNVGKIEWRSLTTWYAFGVPVGGLDSSRDTSAAVETVFLYVPR
jgi:hypothetical protein